MTAREMLIALVVKHQGDWARVAQAIKNHEAVDDAEMKSLSEKTGGKVITLIDPEYPDELKQMPRPPFVLFCEGDVSLLSAKKISFAGSTPEDGHLVREDIEVASEICGGVALKGVATVSSVCGSESEMAALRAAASHGKAIGVKASGLDKLWGRVGAVELRDIIVSGGGLLISEYPRGTEQGPERTLRKTELASSLGDALIIGSSRPHSKEFVMVAFALQMDKEVGVVPHNCGSATNALIKEGAALVEGPEDVLDLLDSVLATKNAA